MGAVVALAALGCQFSPTAPFSGFDDRGSRVVGHFESGSSGGGALSLPGQAATSAITAVEGIIVTTRERPSLTATVDGAGRFTLVGVPSGSFTLVFQLDGRTIGEISLRDVSTNQGIKIVVVLTVVGEVVLVSEERDRVSVSGECPRGPGFWCQNQSGNNPNLSREDFETFADEAAELLKDIDSLNTREEIAGAVCNTGNQFARHLASLALNLAAEMVEQDTTLIGEQTYGTVGEAFDAAVKHLSGANPLSGSQAEALKDVMDRINNAQNVEGCNQLPEDDPTDDDQPPPPPTQPPPSGQLTICHIPPGNYNARHTMTIGASAWPAHQGHCAQGVCDYQGSCR
jgi:hypothetical protein